MIISLSGASGSGKTELARWILRLFTNSGLVLSYTTRDKRESDLPGEYSYVSNEEFEGILKEFAWTAGPYGNQYGTKIDDIHQAVVESQTNRKISIILVTPHTIPNLRQQVWPQGGVLASLYIDCSDEQELRRRLSLRENDPEQVEKRIAGSKTFAAEALRHKGIYWIYNNQNDGLESAKKQMLSVFQKEGLYS